MKKIKYLCGMIGFSILLLLSNFVEVGMKVQLIIYFAIVFCLVGFERTENE